MEKYYRQICTNGYRYVAHSSRRPGLLACLTGDIFFFMLWYRYVISQTPLPIDRRHDFDGKWIYTRDKNNIMLDDQQCTIALPGLFEEVKRAIATRKQNHIKVEELDAIEPKNGYVRAMIYDQELYIITIKGNIYSRELATLHAIHRALISSPTPLPNIEFAFNTDDIVFESVPLWSYARRREGNEHLWLIPDFGYWSWPETKVGTIHEDQQKATEIESSLLQPPQDQSHSSSDYLSHSFKSTLSSTFHSVTSISWSHKLPLALWRGATMNLPLRERLLEMTRDKPWADVVALDWHNPDSMSHDLRPIPQHCKYKYLLHTEGNSYSGRLKYLQACRSVIIAHTMDWLQYHHSLMNADPNSPGQNYVEVDREFNNLENTVEELRRDDRRAQRIAENSVRTFKERYLTAAAEVCYWRKLIRGWAEVSFEPEFYRNDTVTGRLERRGLPFESFALERRMNWDPY